ncbi:sterile alpha motif domain-containing protein 1 [Passer domesticus]|uniref:sterile alpha motif domain-containing protein 1 n=1 Tax=Passer domesticus TaxID=48849 RepID=UPI0030FE0DE6
MAVPPPPPPAPRAGPAVPGVDPGHHRLAAFAQGAAGPGAHLPHGAAAARPRARAHPCRAGEADPAARRAPRLLQGQHLVPQRRPRAAAAPPAAAPPRRPPPVSLRDTARLLGGDGRLTRGRLQGSAAPGGGGGAAGAAPGAGGGGGAGGGARPERTRLGAIATARGERGRAAAGRARKPPCSSSEASAREEEEEEEDEDEEDEDGTGSEASEDAGPPRQLNGEGRGGPPLRPPGQPPPERPPQPKACAPGEGGCQHMAPLKKEGAFGQPDRAVSPALAGAEPSVPLSPGRPGPRLPRGPRSAARESGARCPLVAPVSPMSYPVFICVPLVHPCPTQCPLCTSVSPLSHRVFLCVTHVLPSVPLCPTQCPTVPSPLSLCPPGCPCHHVPYVTPLLL